MSSPCYQCEQREIGCHATCEKYLAFHEANIEKSRERYPNCIYRNYSKNKYSRYLNMMRRNKNG